MLRLIKTKHAFLAPIILTMMMGLNACGEKSMTIPNSLIHSFDHKTPESFRKNTDLSLDEYKPFMGGDIFFLGVALGDPNANTFDIGVQFYTETEERKIFIEKLYLDTPDLKTERVINEFVDIDKLSKNSKLYWKRFMPFEKINGDTIPLTADFFTLRIDYRLDDNPTEQMSIRFDNTSFWAPNI